MTPPVRIEGVSKYYGKLCALEDVSLTVGSGITGLLGPNGAGKTTLIKVLLGLVEVNAGSGELLGHPLGAEMSAIRAHVGYMPEDDCYIPGLTGIEMVQFMARLTGHLTVEGLRRSHEILDYCGISQERYRDVATYSTGMRQQLKFAQAIVHDPDLLILDEPTAGLDPDERKAMLNRIRTLARQAGKTIVVSTHILRDVQEICDQVVIMAAGRVRVAEQLTVLSTPAARVHQLSVLDHAERVQQRLIDEGYEVERDREGVLTIRGLAEQDTGRLWEWVAESGTGIRLFAPARNSLEDYFLSAIEESDLARS